MSTHQLMNTFLHSASLSGKHTDEAAALAFFDSSCVNQALWDTFKGVLFEFQDLDGHRPTTPTPPKVKPCPPPSEDAPAQAEPATPLRSFFDFGEFALLKPTFGGSWAGAPPSTDSTPCGPNRSTCPLHRRKLSRSRRMSKIDFPSHKTEYIDPFIYEPSEPKESDLQERDNLKARCTKSLSSAFDMTKLPEIPADEGQVDESQDLQVVTLGPPPGFPSPRPSFRQLKNSLSSLTSG